MYLLLRRWNKIALRVDFRVDLAISCVLILFRDVGANQLFLADKLPVLVFVCNRFLNEEEPMFFQILDGGAHVRLDLKDTAK